MLVNDNSNFDMKNLNVTETLQSLQRDAVANLLKQYTITLNRYMKQGSINKIHYEVIRSKPTSLLSYTTTFKLGCRVYQEGFVIC